MPPPAVPPAPPAAREVFGDALAVAERYAALLAGAGVERGLIGPREVGRLWERHLLNCAVLGEVVPRQSTVVDVGSGAGLPGVILAVARPDLRVTLLEPLLRRATFLGECVENLGLSNVEVRRARAEEQTGPPEADVVTARAVAPLGRLAEWTLPLLVPGGRLLALKGDRADAELDEAAPVLEKFGVRSAEVVRVGHGKVEPPATVVRVVAGRRRRGSAPAGPPHSRRGGGRKSGSRDRRARGGNGHERENPERGERGEHSEHVAQSMRKRKR